MTFLVKSSYFHMTYFANRARAGQVWLIQVFQFRLSKLSSEINIFFVQWFISHKSKLNEILRDQSCICSTSPVHSCINLEVSRSNAKAYELCSVYTWEGRQKSLQNFTAAWGNEKQFEKIIEESCL